MMRFSLILIFFLTIFLFQNCGEDYDFESIRNGTTQASSESESDSQPDRISDSQSDTNDPLPEDLEDDLDLNDEDSDPTEDIVQNDPPPTDNNESNDNTDSEDNANNNDNGGNDNGNSTPPPPSPPKEDPVALEGYGPLPKKYLTSIPKPLGKLLRVSTSQELTSAMGKLQPGDVLVLNSGVYRAPLIFPQRSWSPQKPTYVMAAPGAKAIIRASDEVNGWASQGNGVWTKSNWTVNSQQVFVNGKLLQQIGGDIFGDYPSNPNHSLQSLHTNNNGIWWGRIDGNQSNLIKDSFHYNKSQKKLFVKVDPSLNLSQQRVEVSVRQHSLSATKVHGLTLSGLQFEHGNTSGKSRGATIHFYDCNNNTIQDLTVLYADALALQIRGNNNLIRNNVIQYSGQTGIGGSGINNRIFNNETSYSNLRGFNPNWAAGGMKFIGDGGGDIPGSPMGLKDSEVAHNLIVKNKSDGFWCDFCTGGGNSIHDNFMAYNEGFGVHVEVSHDSVYYNNITLSNGKRGIYLPGSHRNTVVHNLSAFNSIDGIASIERERVDPPKNSTVIGNLIAWNKARSLRMPTSTTGHKADHNLYLRQTAPTFSLGWQLNLTGLAQWRLKSGMGDHSTYLQRSPSSALQKSINSKDVQVDLSELVNLSNKYNVPAINSPKVNLKSGPPGPL